MNDLPDKPGLYWAKKNEAEWDITKSDWNVIVAIKGVKPFLSYEIWNIEHPSKLASPLSYFEKSIDFLTFSKKIELNSLNNNITVNKTGVYHIANKDMNLALACITGTSPYMRCWVWDVWNTWNNKKTVFECDEPWNLNFLQYVEKPLDRTKIKTTISK